LAQAVDQRASFPADLAPGALRAELEALSQA
jgi:hypothetical protein